MADERIEYLLTVAEAAELAHVEERTLRGWIHNGSLRAYRVRDKNKPGVEASVSQTKLWITRAALSAKLKAKYKIGDKE